MAKEFSLIHFLEKISFLEEKFFNFVNESKKSFFNNNEELIKTKEIIISDIILELIPITDSLEMFIKNFDKKNNYEIEILILIFKLIKNFYKKFNIKQISKTGIMFDPNFHEAIGTYQSNINLKGTIKTVLQPGYYRNYSIIRPALVIVNN